MAIGKIVLAKPSAVAHSTDDDASVKDTENLSADDQVKIIRATSAAEVARIDAETRRALAESSTKVAETEANMRRDAIMVCVTALAEIAVAVVTNIFR